MRYRVEMFEVLLMVMLARGPAAPSAAPFPAPAAASTAGSPSAAPAPGASAGPPAVIVRSASTNSPELRIAVPRAGDAAVGSGEQARTVALEPALAARLYADLDRTADLGRLPVRPCMKSASFGTTTVITFGGQTSPDLQCASDAAGQALNADADAIAQAVISMLPQRRRTQPVFRKNPPPPSGRT